MTISPRIVTDVSWQNPVYPDDRLLTEQEIAVRARSGSLHRAHSPGQRICKVDEVDSTVEPDHVHDFQTCMDWRHEHVVGDAEPWSHWLLYDDWAQQYVPPTPPPTPPPITGWQIRARVNDRGIPFMNGWGAGWIGYTFATLIGPSHIAKIGPGMQTRVTVQADCRFAKMFIGPASSKPFVATSLFQLKFAGQNSGTTGYGPDWQLISDPLPQSFEAPNGIIVSGFVDDGHSEAGIAYMRTRNPEPDWYSRWYFGDRAANLDKTGAGWTASGVNVLAVLMVEAFYGDPPP